MMQTIAQKERFNKIPFKIPPKSPEKRYRLNEPIREFPSIDELIKPQNEALFEDDKDIELMNNSVDLDHRETGISIWLPQETAVALTNEKVEVQLDSQVLMDDIAKTIALAENSVQESKAVLNLTIGGEAVIVEIVKRRNRTRVRFTSENQGVKRLLKNTKVELKEAAANAGLHLNRIEIR